MMDMIYDLEKPLVNQRYKYGGPSYWCHAQQPMSIWSDEHLVDILFLFHLKNLQFLVIID
jgi:hypothetical protein